MLDRADALLLSADLPPREVKGLRLPHRWDFSRTATDGSIRYSLVLPPAATSEPQALFISRIGNQAEIRIDGRLVHRLGELGNPSTDAAKAPVWVDIPTGLLNAAAPTPLEIAITAQTGRWGGLSSIMFGPASALRPSYLRNFAWRQVAAVVIVLSLGLMGLMAGGLWWQQRDSAYGLLALTALFGVIRMSDRIWVSPPLPWPLWGAVTAVAFVVHLMLMARFAILSAGIDTRWTRTGFWTIVVACSSAAILSFLTRQPLIWTFALATLAIPGMVVLVAVVPRAIRTHERNAILLCVAGIIVILAGFRDFLLVRLSVTGSDSFSIMPHAIFVFVLFMGWIVVDRYSHQVRQYRQLNATLEQRIADRERELGETHARLRQKAQEQAALEERQRIMRDIHDGVGAHLVSLMGVVRRGNASPAEMQAHLDTALDELRVAVDSLQPVHGDLVTVLATLRYRLQPRLQAAGLDVSWNVQPLPRLEHLEPTKVLQIQRLLLEAFTNVLRHSRAKSIEVSAHVSGDPESMVLSVADDGVGFDSKAERPQGVGFDSMRARAAAIGATLRITSVKGRGTRVELELPVK